jgi:hypothetical protein
MNDQSAVAPFLEGSFRSLPKLTDDVNRFAVFRKQPRNVIDVGADATPRCRREFTTDNQMLHK